MCNKIADRHYDLSRHPSASPSRWYRREQRRLDNRVHSNTSNIQLGEARRGLSSLRCAYLYLFSRFSYSITILHLISLFGLGSLNCLLPPVGGKQLKHLAAWVQGCRVREIHAEKIRDQPWPDLYPIIRVMQTWTWPHCGSQQMNGVTCDRIERCRKLREREY